MVVVGLDAEEREEPAGELARHVGMDLGDVNADGRADLVTAATGFPPRVSAYAGEGDGSFGADVTTEIFNFEGFVLGDVTGDGRADVIARGTGFPPRLELYRGLSSLGFSGPVTTQVTNFSPAMASAAEWKLSQSP